MLPTMRQILNNKRVIVRDSFDRADSNTTLGQADTGQTWQYLGVGGTPVWGISGNKAYNVTISNYAKAFIESYLSDCIVSGRINYVATAETGFLLRGKDATNWVQVTLAPTGVLVKKYVVNAYTVLATYSFTPVDGQYYKIEAIMKKEKIQIKLDGTTILVVYETFNMNETKHGLRVFTSSLAANRWDDFKITTP